MNRNVIIGSGIVLSFLLLGKLDKLQAQSKTWMVPKEASSRSNPLSGDQASINSGKALYQTYCTPCHGNQGKGNGIAAVSLKPKPADHTSDMIQSESDGSLFYKISEGRTPMPSYKAAFTESQRWALVNYIRTLAKKKK